MFCFKCDCFIIFINTTVKEYISTSKDMSLNLAPKTGSREHPLPLPPVNDILVISLISNS